MRAWRDLPRLRDHDRFEAWLHRLTVNACLDLVRRRRRRPIEVELTILDDPAIADASMGIADRDLLDRALRTLEPEQRAVIVMHHYLGMPLPEVADTLGIPLGTAKSRLSRSSATVRAALADEHSTASRGQYA